MQLAEDYKLVALLARLGIKSAGALIDEHYGVLGGSDKYPNGYQYVSR